MAEIDERKFSEYSMNPGHPDNQGKADIAFVRGHCELGTLAMESLPACPPGLLVAGARRLSRPGGF
jgi:hypothetical protein